jgi:GT2 family glycosyltransferase
MKLSVVIVNYNVRYFLEQCLHAVRKASDGLACEVFVVDNNSVDGSCQMVREKFPEVILIENKENVGFSRANNQAIRQSSGEYILLLNPDTVVEEDSFRKIIAFMDATPDAGGLGVKMIDGKGNFLPESKRGLPTPMVAFYKIFGFSHLFPRSKKFNRYHLGYLSKDQLHEVDVLSGAFMLMRRKALDQVGLLDEDYFMYGEDIDLSYRIQKGGYKNYYFPGTTIIHYKGESTKKGSINYVKVFYRAMVIFAQKHFSKSNARSFSRLINLAIYFRALLAIAGRISGRIFFPVLDAGLIYAGYSVLLPYWENLKFEPGYYPPEFLHLIVPAYILIWLTGIWLSGGYRKPVSLYRLLRGLMWGTLAVLVAYSLASESMRFSRALILLGAAWSFLTLTSYRYLLSLTKKSIFQFEINKRKRLAVVANPTEAERISGLLKNASHKTDLTGFIMPDTHLPSSDYLGGVSQLREIVRINKIDELVFSSEDIPAQQIIQHMLDLNDMEIDYKIAPPESFSIIGSNSISTAGDLYVVHLNSLAKETNRRNKRLLDLALSLGFLFGIIFTIWPVRQKGGFLRNIFQVMAGNRSWVGYLPGSTGDAHLPVLRTGILSPGDLFPEPVSPQKAVELNMIYAKDYRLTTDLEIIFKAYPKLGQS